MFYFYCNSPYFTISRAMEILIAQFRRQIAVLNQWCCLSSKIKGYSESIFYDTNPKQRFLLPGHFKKPTLSIHIIPPFSFCLRIFMSYAQHQFIPLFTTFSQNGTDDFITGKYIFVGKN